MEEQRERLFLLLEDFLDEEQYMNFGTLNNKEYFVDVMNDYKIEFRVSVTYDLTKAEVTVRVSPLLDANLGATEIGSVHDQIANLPYKLLRWAPWDRLSQTEYQIESSYRDIINKRPGDYSDYLYATASLISSSKDIDRMHKTTLRLFKAVLRDLNLIEIY